MKTLIFLGYLKTGAELEKHFSRLSEAFWAGRFRRVSPSSTTCVPGTGKPSCPRQSTARDGLTGAPARVLGAAADRTPRRTGQGGRSGFSPLGTGAGCRRDSVCGVECAEPVASPGVCATSHGSQQEGRSRLRSSGAPRLGHNSLRRAPEVPGGGKRARTALLPGQPGSHIRGPPRPVLCSGAEFAPQEGPRPLRGGNTPELSKLTPRWGSDVSTGR